MTKMKLLLVILAFYIVNSYKSSGNIWYQTYKLNETNAVLNFLTRGRFGFSYIEFTSNINQNFSLVFYTQNNLVKMIQSSNFSLDLALFETNKTVNMLSQEKMKTFGNTYNEIDITVTFPLSYLEENSTILTIGFHDTMKPNVGSLLPKMNQIYKNVISPMNYTSTFVFKYSNRIEFLQYWTTVPYHSMLIICLFLAILLHQQQPLKSKGLFPIITCLLFSNNLVRGYLSNLPLHYLVNLNMCYLESFLNIPNNTCIVLLTVLNYQKFIFIQFINKRKSLIFKSKDGELEIKWYIKWFKILNKPYMYFIYFILSYIFQVILQLIVLFISRLQCNGIQGTLSTIVSILTILAFIFLGLVLVIIEIYLNFESLKRCDIRKIIKKDPYYFRVELYLFALCVTGPLYILYNVIVLIGTFDSILENILITIAFLFLFLGLAFFPIFTTIIGLILKIFEPKQVSNEGEELINLLNTDDGVELIYEACQLEYSLENLACWKDIQQYYKEKTLDQKKKKFKQMERLYLSSDSEMEVNIPSEIFIPLQEKSKKNEYDNNLLKDLELCIIRNLRDTFMRLKNKPEYKAFKSSQQLMKDVNAG